MINEVMEGAFTATDIEPENIQAVHVGNFAGELLTMQAHLGSFPLNYDPVMRGIPTARHEAAFASGSVAALMARAEIEAGIYDLTMVLGVELMKSVDAETGGNFLGAAAWYEKESKGIEFSFPKLFNRLYDELYSVNDEHLAQISTINYENAKRNPKAQTRKRFMNKEHALSTGDYKLSALD